MYEASNNFCDILTEVEFTALSNKKFQEISKYIACLHENRQAYTSSIRVIHINKDQTQIESIGETQ
jgi:hypothetical protein